jgi:K+/H+ antiporter YhaU regulatory subunit KhtT
MIAKELRGEDILAPASQIRFVRVSASSFAGTTLAESGIYEKTGCRVIAIEHESGLSSNPDPNREFTGDEQMTVVGSDKSVQQFLKQFDVSRTEIADQSEMASERAPE